MARIYYNLINKGLKRIDDVPSVWKEEVERLLAEDLEAELKQTTN